MRVQPAILAGMVLVSKFWCEHCSLVIPDILAEGYYSFGRRSCFLVSTENGLFANSSSVW